MVLPSLIAAAQDLDTPAPCNIAFGAGPHFCPGAALTRVLLASALHVFFRTFPNARLVGGLEWQPVAVLLSGGSRQATRVTAGDAVPGPNTIALPPRRRGRPSRR